MTPFAFDYFSTDHLGTVRFSYKVDSSGALIASSTHDYEPFGLEIGPVETSDNTHRFTGHERDAETGNDYMHFRYYGANMGRFAKPDSNFDGAANNPQGWNLYSYVHGNPVNFNDPTGHRADIPEEGHGLDQFGNPVTPGTFWGPYPGWLDGQAIGQGKSVFQLMLELMGIPTSLGNSSHPQGPGDSVVAQAAPNVSKMANGWPILGHWEEFTPTGFWSQGIWGTWVEIKQKRSVWIPASPFDPPFGMDVIGDLMRGHGYIDINLVAAFYGGGTAGIQFNGKGMHFYGGGAAGMGIAGAITWSPDDITPGWQWGLQGTLGASGQVGSSFSGKPYMEIGGGVPAGLTGSVFYVSPKTYHPVSGFAHMLKYMAESWLEDLHAFL